MMMMRSSAKVAPPKTHRIEVQDLKPTLRISGTATQSESSSVSGDDDEGCNGEHIPGAIMENGTNGTTNGHSTGSHSQESVVTTQQLAGQIADLKGCFTHLSHQIAQVMAILRVPPCPCAGCVARSAPINAPQMVIRRPAPPPMPLPGHIPSHPGQPGLPPQMHPPHGPTPTTPQSAPPVQLHHNGHPPFPPQGPLPQTPKSAGPDFPNAPTATVTVSENPEANAILNQLFNQSRQQSNGQVGAPMMAAAFAQNGNGLQRPPGPPTAQYNQALGGGKMKVDRRAVAEYAQQHGAIAAARKFGIPPPVASYYQRKEHKPRLEESIGLEGNIAHTSGSPGFLRGRGRGRPKLIGDELDADLVEYMVTVKQSDPQGHLTASQALAIAKDYILEKAPGLLEEHGGHVKLKLTWAMKLVQRIGERQREIELGLPPGTLSSMQKNLAAPGGQFMADMMAQNILNQQILGQITQSSSSEMIDGPQDGSLDEGDQDQDQEEQNEGFGGATATPEIVNVKELHLPFGGDDDEVTGAIDDEEVRFDEGMESSESC